MLAGWGADTIEDVNAGVRATKDDEPSVGAVLQHELAAQLSELRNQEQRLRQDADSAVHKMRIAARRLRSVLATYRPVLLPGATDELRGELRWLGEELAAARDTQVIHERLEVLVRGEPAELVMGPVTRRIHIEMSARHQAGRRQALEALDDDRYCRLLHVLDSFVADPPFAEVAAGDARKQLPRLLTRDLERLRRRARRVAVATGSAERDEGLHETRKAAKRLRYGAESATPVLGRRAERLASCAKDLQELLGEHQDTVVARRTLRELGAQAYLANENGFTFGRLHALEEARSEQIVARYPAVLKRIPNRPFEG